MNSERTDCCSIPVYGTKNFDTLKKWALMMNPACCVHDDLYHKGWTVHNGTLITVTKRRQADEWFYNDMLKIAQEVEDKYGVMGFMAARDMYKAVRKFGWLPWIRNTFSRMKHRRML